MVLGSQPSKAGDVVEAAVAELGGLDGGVASPVVLPQRAVEDLHGVLDIRGIREAGGHGAGPPIRKDGASPTILTNRTVSGKLIPRRSLKGIPVAITASIRINTTLS